jgi:hypothetical protein
MTHHALLAKIRALDWSRVPLEYQLAAALLIELILEKETSVTQTLPLAPATPAANSNVTPFPLPKRTCWTSICHLDGRRWATASHFGPSGAWEWIVESVCAEEGVGEDQVDCREDPEGGDDFVTVAGKPVYRIEHWSTSSLRKSSARSSTPKKTTLPPLPY